ncbi:MAG: 50S ribosomal protein L5 [Patescibacteria group bacterium]|jgi:large subunit ribosomal protein L5
MNRLQEKYNKEIVPQLQADLKLKNKLSVPRLLKIVINVGMGKVIQDPQIKDTVVKTLTRISGQKPVITLAKKSISNFKIRQGMAIGAKVTIRGERMYDFLDKLINVALPRVRDFRGISKKAIDPKGNLNIGFPEYIVFPEIRSDEVEKLHGLELAVVTNANNKERSIALLTKLGIPFKKD